MSDSSADIIWSLKARDAFWADPEDPKLPLDMPLVVGDPYRVKPSGPAVSAGDVLHLHYLRAQAYVNGIETATDIDGLRIAQCRVMGVSGDTASIKVLHLWGLHDFETQAPVEAEADPFWDNFLDHQTFKNLLIVGRYVLLRWAVDAYVGEELLLTRDGNRFRALHRQSWYFDTDEAFYLGSVRVPSSLCALLEKRIGLLGAHDHWSGRRLDDA